MVRNLPYSSCCPKEGKNVILHSTSSSFTPSFHGYAQSMNVPFSITHKLSPSKTETLGGIGSKFLWGFGIKNLLSSSNRMSLSIPISSTHYISNFLHSPIPPISLYPSFLYYYYPPQFPRGHSTSFVICDYRVGEKSVFACKSSMKNKRGSVFRCCSFSAFGGRESGNGSEGEDDEEEVEEEERCIGEDEEERAFGSFPLPERWDVLGLGQAMVDFSGTVDDEFLQKLGLEKGTRKVVNHEERGKILQAMDGCSYKAAAGGSLSNSLVALARLGSRPIGGPVINVAMAGSVGNDPLGGFYREKLRRANVQFLSAPISGGTTGTVIVLTTPDAQRTMLAYQGTSSTVDYDTTLANLIPKTNILVVEGYLFEIPDTIRTITKACEEAHRNGALVAITASDISCIERHFDDFWEIIENYADIVFANSDEARALCNFNANESTDSATRCLSFFVPLVSVTDGPRGSYIGMKGETVYIPPSPCIPVDTCGAGDAYASGIMYGVLRGISDVKRIGKIAANVAATVVGQQGTRLRVSDAVKLAESVACQLETNGFSSDIGTDHISSF